MTVLSFAAGSEDPGMDELSIPARRVPIPAPLMPTRETLERTLFSLPAFWMGAAAARKELNAGVGVCAQIVKDLRAGTPISESAAYKAWLAQ